MSEGQNPFPGPQPYRAADRARFFGRDALVKKLAHQLLGRRSTTLYGPSGAGKSSLMQAGVIPRLVETHDFRVVRVDGWPPGEAPLSWIVRAIFADLDLGAVPADTSEFSALDEAMSLAERRSEQPILIYLDQIEQVLLPDRAEGEARALFGGVDRLARATIQGLQIVLALREDYLGHFRDRACDCRALLAYGFRLGALTVGEMVHAVCRAAAIGEPPQRWEEEQLRGLMREVQMTRQRASDEAEVQAAYAQIVCRTLFQQRASGGPGRAIEGPANAEPGFTSISAEVILRRYLDTTLNDLGPLRPDAQRLLEDHLITADGSRTLRTEKELLQILPEGKLAPILKALEGAAILHAEAHEGSRFFEIGHDWLAGKVSEARLEREREEQRAEERAQVAKARKERLVWFVVAMVAMVLGTYAVWMGMNARRQQQNAEDAHHAAEEARNEADKKAVEASNARLLAGFRELKTKGEFTWAMQLLPEVQAPEAVRGWIALASDVLSTTRPEVVLRGHTEALSAVVWSHDSKHILTASADHTARVWHADGRGEAVVLAGHQGPITSAAFSPEDTRVVTASEDRTARVWRADDGMSLAVLRGHEGAITSVAFSPDGTRVVTASEDGTARVWRADDGMSLAVLRGHEGAITSVAFGLDGTRVVTASVDRTARVWRVDGTGQPMVLRDHTAEVVFLAVSPDGKRVVTTSYDETARIWDVSGSSKPIPLKEHQGRVVHAAWSPDGTRVATASVDKTVRIWSADGKGTPVVLAGHDRAVTLVAFRPDGKYVATASVDQTVRIWPSEGGAALVLGHKAPVRSLAWSPNGARLLTGTSGESERLQGYTARIWHPEKLELLRREGQGFFHSARINAEGNRVISAYDDATARLWSIHSAAASQTIYIGAKGKLEGWVASAALSPDSKRSVITLFDGTARIVPVPDPGAPVVDVREPVVLTGHDAAVRAAAFSPNDHDTLVATVSDDKTARLWKEDGTRVALLTGHEDGLTSAAWSPDGTRIVTTSLDQTARVWRLEERCRLRDAADLSALDQTAHVWRVDESCKQMLPHHGSVRAAAWSPDGKRIVTASEDGTARVWDADNGTLLMQHEHDSPVLSVVWSGERIASSSRKGQVHIWSAEDKGEPIELDAQASILAMAFLDKGSKIVTIAEDNTTRTWTIDADTLLRELHDANVGCLPQDMREIYLGELKEAAKEHFDACQRGEHARPAAPVTAPVEDILRAPSPPPPASPSIAKSLGSEMRRVTLVVLPGDASIEVDGQPALRRDGVIDLVGKPGAQRRVLVSRGTKRAEEKLVEVTGQGQGASPEVVDLNALLESGVASSQSPRRWIPKPIFDD